LRSRGYGQSYGGSRFPGNPNPAAKTQKLGLISAAW